MFNHFRQNITSLDLIPASGGAFEVTVNGEKIYSKLDTGKFPSGNEIIATMEKLKS